MVLRRLRGVFGKEEASTAERPASLFGLDEAERDRIGTEDDPLRGFEAAMERHAEAGRAEQSGDPEKAIRLYETSVAEGFVGSHPIRAARLPLRTAARPASSPPSLRSLRAARREREDA